MSEMAEQTTDRAIALLEGNMPYLKGDPSEWVYSLAITALRAQGEAERKIEKAVVECKKAISDIGHSQPYVDACEDILQILEGKAKYFNPRSPRRERPCVPQLPEVTP